MDVPDPISSKKMRVVPFIFVVLGIGVIAFGLTSTYALAFQDRIYPGVRVAGHAVGGETVEEIEAWLNESVDLWSNQTVRVVVEGEEKSLSLETYAQNDPDLTRPVVFVDTHAVAEAALHAGRTGNAFFQNVLPLTLFIERPNVSLSPLFQADDLSTRLLETYPRFYDVPDPTAFDITRENDEWVVRVVPGETGKTLDTAIFLEQLTTSIDTLSPIHSPFEIPVRTVSPSVTENEAQGAVPEVLTLLKNAPLTIRFDREQGPDQSWTLTDDDLANVIVPTPSGARVSEEALAGWIAPIADQVNVAPRNARMEIDGGRVRGFVSPRDGLRVNIDATIDSIVLAITDPLIEEAELVVDVDEPDEKPKDVNDLGIVDVLGVGVSDFSGSPPNRIKNIQNGARLLDGILIPPGETFSLLNALKPFTAETGYMPELVIEGDQLVPQTRWGRCASGTTTFRATMNSGLKVTERRNHSLVVTYYNDPMNGNPGTDATIYEPAPDYKLTNDTEHHVLFTTFVDLEDQKLYFTFWGTPDGRKGSYSAPVVSNWTGAGETRYIETTELTPGVEKCQGSHPGANASFTYSVQYPDGTTHEEEFTSHYRSLPRICLVGVENISEEPTPTDDEPTAEDDLSTSVSFE